MIRISIKVVPQLSKSGDRPPNTLATPGNLADLTGLSDFGALTLLCDAGDFVIHHPIRAMADSAGYCGLRCYDNCDQWGNFELHAERVS